jgi:hypothetical protein
MLRLVGHAVVVNPDKELLRVARQEGWDVVRCDRLSRRLKAGAGLVGAAVAGGVGSAMLATRRRRRVARAGLPWLRRGMRRRVALRAR